MKLLDLFAGIGGFSLAAHWMGWETVAFVERDKFCQKVLQKNFPNIPLHNDIFEFSGKPFRGFVDIVTGGFPCQPFSAAGKQRGKEDARYLFPEMLRVISEVRPRWVVAENVRRLLGNNNGETFEEICSHLEGESYDVATFCIPASSFDAPHRRERVWIVASDADATRSQRTFGEDYSQRAADHRSDRFQSSTRRQDRIIADTGRNGYGRHNGLNENRRKAGARKSEGVQLERIRPEFGGNCPVIADAGSARFQGDEQRRAFIEDSRPPRSITERFENENWYEAATRFCRVDDGIPYRMDRIKSLGNTVVPFIPYEIFRAIKASE